MAVALKDDPSLFPANGRPDDLLYGCQTQSAARDFGFIDGDVEHRQARRLFDLHVGRATNVAKDASNPVSSAKHRFKFIAENLDGDVAPNPGQQLVEAHLDRLCELV